MNTYTIYTTLDLFYSIAVAALAFWLALTFLPETLSPLPGMALAMFGGMALGCAIGIFASAILGMFETMYIGCFSGMAAGMMGAMVPPGHSLFHYALLCAISGSAVWAVLALMNSVYRKRGA